MRKATRSSVRDSVTEGFRPASPFGALLGYDEPLVNTFDETALRLTAVNIERLAHGGASVAHLPDGRTAFISGGCPGDTVSIEVTEDKGRFVRARITEVLLPSDRRVEAPCPYFGSCGGCQWQHIDYDLQLSAKREIVVDSLRRIGGIMDATDLVRDTVASPRQYGYRNKVEFVVDPRAKRLTLGYHPMGSTDVVPVESCLLLPKRFVKAPKALTGALRYVAGSDDLGISRVQLRVAHYTKDAEVAIWTPPGGFPRQATARTLGQALPLTSIVRVMHKGPVKERKVSKVEVLSGRGHWREKLGEYEYGVSAPSFFQVNTKVAEKMCGIVIDALEPDGTDHALDLFAGVGTFTLPLAELAGQVAAVEAYGSAVRDLRRNLEDNQLWAEVVGGDAEREIETMGHFDLAIVDPPRSGIKDGITRALASSSPRAFVYVSCDPATLARDAKTLTESGYRLKWAIPVDLFPQTYHVETICMFEPAGR